MTSAKAAPELLLPAGGIERMRAAFDFGADAVYAGSPRYSLRARNNEFAKLSVLETGIAEAHARGKKFFVTVNVLPHNSKLTTFVADMAPIIAMQPDALIMADPGLIMQVRELWPDMPIHLSVQANTTNYWGVKFWQQIGISRIILSRELSLTEIAEIRQACPDIELEVFVHGALCIAYSGRCLLSGYFNHRDPNQGTCTNACRWQYDVYQNTPAKGTNDQVRHPQAEAVYWLEEHNRPGELMPISEDEHGTYIMNSRDLRALEVIEDLIKIGVDSLKVEGRTKSLYYVARTAQTYRRAIDDAMAGKPFDVALLAELEGLANRGYTTGFLERHRTQDYQNYLDGHSLAKRSVYVGQVISVNAEGMALIDVKNRFGIGDSVEIIHPSGNEIRVIRELFHRHQPIKIAAGNGIQVEIPDMAGRDGALLARLLSTDE